MNLFDRVVYIEFEDRKTGEKFTIGNTVEGYEGIKITFQVEKQISTEPNVAYIELYNLSDSTRQKINFKQDVKVLEFGAKINVIAGYRGQEKRIFSGVVVSASSPKEGNIYVTRINARNIFFELIQKKINRTAAKGELKERLVLNILSDIGASIDSASKKILTERFNGATFKDTTTFLGTASSIINQINEGLTDRINIYFDDVGVNFNPLGVALDIDAVKYSKNSGLIGTPDINEKGADFKVLLDPTLKLNTPVILDSETIRAINPTARYVVSKVIHVGSNRSDDVFETRAQSVYEYLKLPAVG